MPGGGRERHLLVSVCNGLFSQSLGRRYLQKLQEWFPARIEYGRAQVFVSMLKWKPEMHPACEAHLLRALAGEHEQVWRVAGQVLSRLMNGDPATKSKILELARRPRTAETLRSALHALGAGWSSDRERRQGVREISLICS